MKGLAVNNLSVTVNGKEIICNLSLSFLDNQIYALVGRNGSGKSTLLNAIMGAPRYQITSGNIRLDDQDITSMPTSERAQLGLFLAMQYPVEIVGISYADFLCTALTKLHNQKPNMTKVLEELQTNARRLNFPNFDYSRDVNVGFSGGEKKKSEIMQMLAIKPRFAFLDEPDSGLDAASVRKLSTILRSLDYPTTIVIVSHNEQLVNNLHPSTIYDMEQLS